MGFVLKLMDFVLKLMNFVPKLMDFVLKLMDFVQHMRRSAQRTTRWRAQACSKLILLSIPTVRNLEKQSHHSS